MAKPNFSFKKRQREEAKEAKRKAKLERKAERAASTERGAFDANAPGTQGADAANATGDVDQPGTGA